MSAIPLLKSSISISPYAANAEGKPRFLLEMEDRHFLVSSASRALVLALMSGPANEAELVERYYQHQTPTETSADKHAENEHLLSANELIQLAQQTLPAALFHDAPSEARRMPFTLSTTVLPQRAASFFTGALAWLFTPWLALVLTAVFTVLHICILPAAMQAAHTGWGGISSVQLVSLLLLSGLLHELGHTAACRYFGCPHGSIGFGLYFIFPAWYADVSKAWRLAPKQRAVVDLGGVYFQALLLIAIDAYALQTGSEFALKLIWLITLTMLFTLNPVFKFDGYWLLSDLSGLHNLHQQVQKSSSSFFANLFGRGKFSWRGQWLLHSYALLSLSYFVYFSLFLVREVRSIFGKFPDAMLSGIHQVSAASSHGDGEQFGLALLHLLGDVLWPLVIFSACFFFLDKLRRTVLEVNGAIFSPSRSVK